MRIYPLTRWFSIAILITYLGVRLKFEPSWWSELILFNLVVIAVIISILRAPKFDDPTGRWSVIAALASWGVGSVTSSIDSFFGSELSNFSEISYLLFYPLALFGLVRTLRTKESNRAIEMIDTLLIAFGGTTLLAAFALERATHQIAGSSFEVFLSIIYPIADLVLLLAVSAIVLLQQLNPKNLLIISGVAVFAITDFYYLWRSANATYIFGSLSDSGWLISFILIANAFWYPGDELSNQRNLNPIFVSVALVLSLIVLTIAVLNPDYFPRFVLIPSFATLLLAFLRMSIAMNDARRAGEERNLARTDELTGLANRRRFLAEFEPFQERVGSLLILDLDGFKSVNDNLGHEIGDELLKQVARRFERVIPKEALLARLGGDEFGLLSPGLDGQEIALALRATLSYPFKISGHEIRLDVSIGEAFCEAAGETNLLRRADEAMYQAKRQRSGVVRWSASIMK